MSTPKAPFWNEAVNNEIESIVHNHTWELVDFPMGNKASTTNRSSKRC